MIGVGCLVTHDVSDNSVVYGDPARSRGKINTGRKVNKTSKIVNNISDGGGDGCKVEFNIPSSSLTWRNVA
jgi:hypothetical protein